MPDLRYHRETMFSLITSRMSGRKLEDLPAVLAATASEALADATPELKLSTEQESTILLTIGWVTAGMGALAVGLFVGRELRQLYKFNRRTPYDFYKHSGDEHEIEFGVGV